MTVKSDIDKIRDKLNWFFAIFISLMVFFSAGAVRAELKGNSNREDIVKIQKDYLSYDAFVYIIESNNKLINILTAIESKDDHKYQQAIKDWSDLQQEIIKQYGKNKIRGGGINSVMSK